MRHRSRAPGKIILSGEYAVIFGYAGVALPSVRGIEVTLEENSLHHTLEIFWEDVPPEERWLEYVRKIVRYSERSDLRGQLTIRSNLPLGKGMGSSTALVIAVTRALCGDGAREDALHAEDALNPGHSGLDFAVIWEDAPVLFQKGTAPQSFGPLGILKQGVLIDTGSPSESTSEMVAWVRSREAEIRMALQTIGNCTTRLAGGEPLSAVMHDHHRAQIALGVVPLHVQDVITEIEGCGGAAKVIGAGSRTGGAGMVLALGKLEDITKIAHQRNMPTLSL